MRICLVAHRFYDGNTHMMQFANALAQRGDEVDVICLRRPGLPICSVVDNVNVYRIQGRNTGENRPLEYLLTNIGFFFHAALVLAWHHLRKRYALVHVQSIPDFLVFTAIVPKLMGTPVILDLRDIVPELYASRFRLSYDSALIRVLLLIERLSIAFANHVIIANPVWYERIVGRAASPAKCTMMWYYADQATFYARPKRRKDGKFVLMYPGSLHWHQGLDIAVRAFRRVLKSVPEAELHIYGDGPEKANLVALTEKLGLQEQVKLRSYVPLAEAIDLMSETDVAVVPKRASCTFGNEAASTKIVEFLSLGVPIVASRTKVERSLYDDSLLQYFESGNEEDFARAVVSIYRDQELKWRLIAAGLRYTAQNSWVAKIGIYLDLVDGLVRPETVTAPATVVSAPEPMGQPPADADNAVPEAVVVNSGSTENSN